MGHRKRSTYPPWWVILAVWTGWGLFLSTAVAVYTRLGGKALPFLTAFRLNMPGALVWAALTPAIVWLGRRVPPFEGRRWPRGAAVNVLASMAAVFLEVLVMTVNQRWMEPMSYPAPVLVAALRSFVWWFPSDALIYWAILAIDYGIRHYDKLRERELRASQLEAQLSEVRLQALKAQLQPHFLFNALHTVGQLIRTGQHGMAVRVVAGLGDLLRRVLDGGGTQEVPLKQELEFVRGYLDIEQIRFRDRLRVVVDADPETLDARVPHLILQPLVENAIHHGIAPRALGGSLVICARHIDGNLHVTVRDDGSGLAARAGAEARGMGVGLANTSARLRQLYGASASFEVVNAADGGVAAHLVLPFQLAAVDWQGAREAAG